MVETAPKETTETRLHSLTEALESGRVQHGRQTLNALHPAEIARLLESLPRAERIIVWELVDPEKDGDVLLYVNDEVRDTLIREMDPQELLAAAEGMDTDDLADFLQDLPEAVVQQLLRSMDEQDRQRVEGVLSYPEDTAAGLMNTDTITVRPDVSLDVVLRYLRRRGKLPEMTDALIVVNREDKYLGLLSIADLLTQAPDLTVAEVMSREQEPIAAGMKDTEVAHLFEQLDLISAPVVDEDGKLVGRITIDDVVDVIRDEAESSFMGMAGLQVDEDLFAPVWHKALKRWPWLAINLVTAFIASRVIGLFEETIVQLVALAALMPIIAAVAGNTGNQTIALLVRALALEQITTGNAKRLLFKELGVSAMNGIVWGTVVALFAYAFYHQTSLALVMGSAMLLNLLVAALTGVFIPLLLKKMGRDPALGSSVFLTATTDSMGFFIFLGLATIFLL